MVDLTRTFKFDGKYGKDRITEKIDEFEFTLELERDYFIELCLRDKKYRRALFRDKTKVFKDSLKDSVLKKSNIIGLLNGFTRSGKSIAAQSILFMLRKIFRDELELSYPIEIGFTREEMKQALESITPPFGLVQDELPNESGKDSQLKFEAVKNISESIRYLQISILLCTPVKQGAGFVNFKLLMCGTNEAKNELRAFLFEGDEKHPSGMVTIPYHRDTAFHEQYLKKKEKFLSGIKESGGYLISDFNKKKAERDINRFYLKFKEEYGTALRSKADIISLMELAEYNETENFKKRVASAIKARFVKDALDEKKAAKNAKVVTKPEEFNEYGVSEKPVAIWEDAGFKEIILKNLEFAVDEDSFRIFRRICDGESYRYITAQTPGLNIKKINHIKDRIQQGHLGYIGEKVYLDFLQSQGKKVEHFGGNQSEPDFINHSDREVVSFKCYTLPNSAKAKKEVAPSEVATAAKLRYKCYLLIFELQTGVFLKYRVTVPQLAGKNDLGNFSTPPQPGSRVTPPLTLPPSTAPPPPLRPQPGGGVPKIAAHPPNPRKKKRRRRR